MPTPLNEEKVGDTLRGGTIYRSIEVDCRE